MESLFVCTVILYAGLLCTQGLLSCGLTSHAGSSSKCSIFFSFYHGATALVAKVFSLSRIHDHIQLNTVYFSPKVMGQSIFFLVFWKIHIKS